MNRMSTRLRLSYQSCRNTVDSFGTAVVCLACLVALGCTENESAKPGAASSGSGVAKTVIQAPKTEVPSTDDSSNDASGDDAQVKTAVKPIDDQPVVNDPAFHPRLTEAVDSYLQYPMVNSVAMEAPAECAAPSDESRPIMSKSVHESTHGGKLYYLFAKDITDYLSQIGNPSPEGQVLVKESWTSKTSNPDARNQRNHASGVRITPRTTVGDKVLEIGKRKELFVMMKLHPDTANTDMGWIYGVVDPNTKKITAAGRVAACMRCHQDAKNDRLFGYAMGD